MATRRRAATRSSTRAVARALDPARALAQARKISKAQGRVATAARAAATPATTASPAQRTAPRKRAGTPRLPGAGRWHRVNHLGPAGGRPYAVYVPAGLRRTTAAPLLVVLHGCGQSVSDIARSTRFNELADRKGFVVAYPEQVANQHANRCWQWFEAGHQERDRGEPAVLAAIIREICAEGLRWRIDRHRVYVTGMSAGGAMAMILGATYPELFAGIAAHSGLPYRSAASARHAWGAMTGRPTEQPPISARATGRGLPPMIIFQGTVDRTVAAVNATRMADQWLELRAATTGSRLDPARIARSETRTAAPASGRPYTSKRWYTAGRRLVLELVLVDGLGHAWSGGGKGVAFSDPKGPHAAAAMWAFLSRHRQPWGS